VGSYPGWFVGDWYGRRRANDITGRQDRYPHQERVRNAIESLGENAQGHIVDLSEEQALETLFGKIGPFDHLVFTARDSLHFHDLATTDLKDVRRAFDLRYWAALAAVKYGVKNAQGQFYRAKHRSCRAAPA
jgi:hypothetical protein